jgi:hypothetical protein
MSGFALFAVAGGLYVGGYMDAYNHLVHVLGGYSGDAPFSDLDTTLSWMECYRQGVDVFVSNPCDVLGRIMVYSPIWLLGSYLHLNTSWTPVVGVALDLVFLGSLVLLPPARTWRGTLVIVAATVSNAVVFAVELANADVLMFVLLVLAGLAALRPMPVRLVAYPLIVMAALLKYYPVAALIIALRERPGWLVLVTVFSVLSLGAFVYVDAADILRALRFMPGGDDLYMFGARSLPYGLLRLFPRFYSVLSITPGMLEAIVCGITVILAAGLATRRDLVNAMARLSEAERMFLLLGSVVLVACFFTGQSYRYRAVFFLCVLPAITTLWTEQRNRLVTLLFGVTTVSVVFLMWGYYLARLVGPIVAMLPGAAPMGAGLAAAFWLGREMIWWWVVGVMLAALLVVMAESGIGRDFTALWARGGGRWRDGAGGVRR